MPAAADAYAGKDAQYQFTGCANGLATIKCVDTAKPTTVPLRLGAEKWMVSLHAFPGTPLYDAMVEAVKELVKCEGPEVSADRVLCSDNSLTARLAFKMFRAKGLGGKAVKQVSRKQVEAENMRGICAVKVLFLKLGLKVWRDDKGVLQPGLRVCMMLFDEDTSVTEHHTIEMDLADATGFSVEVASDDDDDDDLPAPSKGKGKKRKIGGK